MKKTAAYWIDGLGLEKHPEGGYFKEIYRSDEEHHQSVLPERYGGNRNFGTAIYFLLDRDDFSAFHRLNSDEAWHLYDGGPLLIHMIDPEGNHSTSKLGLDLEKNESPFAIMPRGCWFAAELIDKSNYALLGCTVAPGFHFDDFVLAESKELIRQFPQHKELISRLTRK
ncbi:MAG: cupin domain-containing protein [Bacteroidales bacterium]|nr:cupin domain-containing protein [Bacteroidales bacterium]MCF8352745.1 cupin domain-containing protein [Bacteroidales bacterium]MCF8375409.1 cupin domain-containing protein [Bacteroidales bacterium]MCF8400957.1 cupin domain-containing protein [Bacteroidales bacterium]